MNIAMIELDRRGPNLAEHIQHNIIGLKDKGVGTAIKELKLVLCRSTMSIQIYLDIFGNYRTATWQSVFISTRSIGGFGPDIL